MTPLPEFGTALAQACLQTRTGAAWLGCYMAELSDSALWRHGDAGATEDWPALPVLCCARLFTSTLVLMAAHDFGFDLQDTLSSVVSDDAAGLLPPWANEVGVAHLLNHTHGLGDALPECATFDAAGYIDAAALRRAMLREGVLHAPGKCYGYGALGYLLLGWMLERLYRQRWCDILYGKLLQPLATSAARTLQRPTVSCPASGMQLQLSLPLLLAFCRELMSGASRIPCLHPGTLSRIADACAPLPGWSPHIVASGLGWRDFGHGWLGHNGLEGNSLCMVRINPGRGQALCLMARGAVAGVGLLPAMLLRSHYPELVFDPRQQPAIVATPAPDRPAETFGSPCRQYRLETMDGRTRLEIIDIDDGGTVRAVLHACQLYPAAQQVFYLARPWHKLTFMQLIVEPGSDTIMLWDGNHVWPPVEVVNGQ